MAETTGILNNRKFLVAIYLFILTLVGLAIGAIIFIYNDSKDLYSNDYEEYRNIEKEISQLKEDYDNQLKFIEKKETDLNNTEPTLENLESLLTDHNDAIQINNQIIFRNERALELILKDEDLKIAEADILLNKQAKETHIVEIAKLLKRQNLLKFSQELNKSLTCYEAINTNANSEAISTAAANCKKDLTNTRNSLRTLDYDFPKTNEYLSEIENYWSITVSLNIKLEAKDQPSADQLSDELTRSSEKRSTLEGESESEISEYIRSL